MKNFKPYKIYHFDLCTGEDFEFLEAREEGRYVILWWKSFPLGEVFISPRQSLTLQDFSVKLNHALRAALTSYTNLYGGNHQNTTGDLSLQEIKKVCTDLFNDKFINIPDICDISVVICTRDRAEILFSCLTELMKQRCRPAEIIVVDNASVNEYTKLVVEQFKGVTYHREDRPGLDIARNTGAKIAKHPIVAYTDDDTKPHPLWTYHVFHTFNNQTIDAMTGLVIAAALDTEAQMVFEKHWPFNRGYADKIFDKTFFEKTLPIGPPVWEVGAGANMAFRKKIFEQVGYFDERLDVGASGCSGDSEMWYRILANGLTIQYNPRAVVYHLHRDSMSGLHRQLFYYMRGFTVAILIQHQRFKHKGNLKHLFITVPKYYLYLLRKGFPYYRFRHQTLLSEMRGIFSGLLFYLKHRSKGPNV